MVEMNSFDDSAWHQKLTQFNVDNANTFDFSDMGSSKLLFVETLTSFLATSPNAECLLFWTIFYYGSLCLFSCHTCVQYAVSALVCDSLRLCARDASDEECETLFLVGVSSLLHVANPFLADTIPPLSSLSCVSISPPSILAETTTTTTTTTTSATTKAPIEKHQQTKTATSAAWSAQQMAIRCLTNILNNATTHSFLSERYGGLQKILHCLVGYMSPCEENEEATKEGRKEERHGEEKKERDGEGEKNTLMTTIPTKNVYFVIRLLYMLVSQRWVTYTHTYIYTHTYMHCIVLYCIVLFAVVFVVFVVFWCRQGGLFIAFNLILTCV